MTRGPITVTAAVLKEKDRVLIARRRAGGLRGGLWEFPGGKIEPGETAPEALRRELREELGIEAMIGDFFLETEHTYPDLIVRLLVYWASIESGTPAALDHEELRWVTPAELPQFPIVAGDGVIVAEIGRRLGAGSNQ
jgi:mutator protein MutT